MIAKGNCDKTVRKSASGGFCLALSACYELLEWGVAEATGTAADAFLGTQGDPWDTQWDMLTASIGATFSLFIMPRWQDRQLRKLGQG